MYAYATPPTVPVGQRHRHALVWLAQCNRYRLGPPDQGRAGALAQCNRSGLGQLLWAGGVPARSRNAIHAGRDHARTLKTQTGTHAGPK
jgi:hypothetical protein